MPRVAFDLKHRLMSLQHMLDDSQAKTRTARFA
jgi:hypothetical protein